MVTVWLWHVVSVIATVFVYRSRTRLAASSWSMIHFRASVLASIPRASATPRSCSSYRVAGQAVRAPDRSITGRQGPIDALRRPWQLTATSIDHDKAVIRKPPCRTTASAFLAERILDPSVIELLFHFKVSSDGGRYPVDQSQWTASRRVASPGTYSLSLTPASAVSSYENRSSMP